MDSKRLSESILYIDIYIFVNLNWVDTLWQQYSTHLHTNNTQNNKFVKEAIALTIYSPSRHVLATKFQYSYSKPCPGEKYGISYLTERRASARLLGTCCRPGWPTSRQTRVEIQLLEIYTCSKTILRPVCLSPIHGGFSTVCNLALPNSRSIIL